MLPTRYVGGNDCSETERAFNAGISAAIDIVEKMDMNYYSLPIK